MSASERTTETGGRRTHRGSCHCGAVRFEVELDLGAPASECNCSICVKSAVSTQIVKPLAFRLLSDESALGRYEWGGRTSTRFFCPRCAIHCFARGHLAQLGGDYVSVNVNCLDGVELVGLPRVHWDGRHDNWQAGPRSTPWPIAPG